MLSKELSWLYFNERVLEEANCKTTPLMERVKFLGIFSSNLDEFFKVRVAVLNRLSKLKKSEIDALPSNPVETLKAIQKKVVQLQKHFDGTYSKVIEELEKKDIFLLDEKQLDDEQKAQARQYFHDNVRHYIYPIVISQQKEFPDLNDNSIYLAVDLCSSKNKRNRKYSLIELPKEVSRFYVLPDSMQRTNIMFIDDVIRLCLPDIYSFLNFDILNAYTIKISRNAELKISKNLSVSYLDKISQSISKRRLGQPVRLIYDKNIPSTLLNLVSSKLQIKRHKATVLAGQRYHNFKDLFSFPKVNRNDLYYKLPAPMLCNDFEAGKSLLGAIKNKDVLLNYPYQSFDHVIDLLREASIDPYVRDIKITLYRVAKNSHVINALVNAARNGKNVMASLELQARFDEEANVNWTNVLEKEGVHVIHGMQEIKVHCKLIFIRRKVGKVTQNFAHVGTGNFNESTARLYSDHSILTAREEITKDVRKVFDLLEHHYKMKNFKYLMVSPFNVRKMIYDLISFEEDQLDKGKQGEIILKMNNFTDYTLIKKLFEAAKKGVKIRLMIRGMFAMELTRENNPTGNIQAKRLIDKYLEHDRIYYFHHGGEQRTYISSADWMPRNLDHRIEVGCPILDKGYVQRIYKTLELQWKDDAKQVDLSNPDDFSVMNHKSKNRFQDVVYDYIKDNV